MPDESRDEDVVVLEVIPFENDHDLVARLGFAILDEPRMSEPLGPLSPDDLVGIMLFLCSPASAFVTGQSINLDGGVTG